MMNFTMLKWFKKKKEPKYQSIKQFMVVSQFIQISIVKLTLMNLFNEKDIFFVKKSAKDIFWNLVENSLYLIQLAEMKYKYERRMNTVGLE